MCQNYFLSRVCITCIFLTVCNDKVTEARFVWASHHKTSDIDELNENPSDNRLEKMFTLVKVDGLQKESIEDTDSFLRSTFYKNGENNDRICTLKIKGRKPTMRNGSASFQLRVARSTSSHLKQLIKNALEKTLNQCQQLNLLPSNIFLSHSKRPRFNLYSRRRTGFEQIMENRCSKLIDILIYAQQILC